MRPSILAWFLLLYLQGSAAFGQLTLEVCREKARANYPMIRQFDLIDKTAEYNLSNAGKGYLPQVALMAKATYQSEVTEIPINIPGIPSFNMSRDQYQAVSEVNQLIWDGGVIKSQKEIIRHSAEVEKQGLEVSLYALNERVNQLYFGILVIQEQLKQTDILEASWQTNIDRVGAGIQNGTANQADMDAILVEKLKTAQRRTELLAMQHAYKQMLSAMIGEAVGERVTLVKPEYGQPQEVAVGNHRPELRLFESQQALLDGQRGALQAASLPKVGLFLQGGVGRPGLNFLNNEFSPFYLGGARLTWNLGSYYPQRNNLAKIGLSGQAVDLQRELFLYTIHLADIQQNSEIQKIRELISRDGEIIRLRENIRKSSEIRVENGTLSVSELIRDIQSEDLSKQEKSLHEIQLLLSICNKKNLTNN